IPGALESIDADCVDTELLRLHGEAHRGTLVNDLDAGALERGNILRRIASGSLHDRYGILDNDAHVPLVIEARVGRKQSQVDSERLRAQVTHLADFLGEI